MLKTYELFEKNYVQIKNKNIFILFSTTITNDMCVPSVPPTSSQALKSDWISPPSSPIPH